MLKLMLNVLEAVLEPLSLGFVGFCADRVSKLFRVACQIGDILQREQDHESAVVSAHYMGAESQADCRAADSLASAWAARNNRGQALRGRITVCVVGFGRLVQLVRTPR